MATAEFECRKCGKVVSFEQHGVDRFCPDCGTLLSPRRQPKFWLFQFNPIIYRWFDWLKENRETEQWLISRYAGDIKKGDKVAIWASGAKAGVYAIGEIMTNPSERPLNLEQQKYWAQQEDAFKFEYRSSVTIRHLKVFIDSPLLEDQCRKDPVLSTMEILKQSQGTNFWLTKEQWNRILELVDEKH